MLEAQEPRGETASEISRIICNNLTMKDILMTTYTLWLASESDTTFFI